MNLTTGEWIPVVWDDGKAGRVSLLTVFEQGDRIRDLAVRPHERIALMRLLVCIAQAALDGPRNRDDWKRCLPRLPEAAREYLARWQHAFELFGEGPRFLQTRSEVVETDDEGAADVSKLSMTLASGNNTTLFDNAGGSGRVRSDADLALDLLTYQNYSPLVGRGYKGRSPCIEGNMLHTSVVGRNLLETIGHNLLTKEQVTICMGAGTWGGRAVWEFWNELLARETDAIKEATTCYVARLCPVERAIWLGHDRCSLQMGNGFEYPPFREATATIVTRRGTERRFSLAGSVETSIWRELPSIVVKSRQEENPLGGPLAFQNLSDEQDLVIWTGALLSDGKSKLLDAIEGVYAIPAAMFTSVHRERYQEGVAYSVATQKKLDKAIAVNREALNDRLDGRRFWKRGNLVKQKASAHYWTAIEQKVPLLLDLVRDPSPLRPDDAERDQWGGTEWGRALARAAREAYDLACPRETPRQLKAYALGLNALFKPVEAAKDEATPEEETE